MEATVANKGYFPMFFDISGKEIIVFGGGNIASRRIKTLLMFDADVHLVSPDYNDDLDEYICSGKIKYDRRKYTKGEINKPFFVIAATDDHDVNNDIYNECKEKDILVNVISDVEKCDFHFPGIAKNDNVVIGVNAGGHSHKVAKRVTVAARELLNQQEELTNESLHRK